MDWEQALRARALADAGVTALVGSDGADWGERPQDRRLPWLGLELVSDPRPQDLKGFVSRRESRVQVDCLALDRPTAAALREAAIAALVPAAQHGGVRFGRALVEPVRRTSEKTGTGYVHRDSFDLLIWHD